MKIIKKINTSAVVALDSNGEEIVVIGKGIGFPQVPYELEDLTKIEKTFYSVQKKYVNVIKEIPQSILIVCGDIADQAEIMLNCTLNPNLPFTLADHINFAMERLKNGVNLTSAIAYDISHLYSREYEMGQMALEMLSEKTGIILPDYEKVNLAMHFINAELESGDVRSVMQMAKIVDEITNIVERHFMIKIDKEDYSYNRFTMHIRYLIQRLQKKSEKTNSESANMLHTLAKENPDIYLCANKIVTYLRRTWKWNCNDEEVLYLMLHINRMKNR